MELYKSVFLGIVQGITEFLPVSSSGHLVIFQQLAGIRTAEIFFDICLHIGTLVAVIFYFRKDLADIIKSCLTGLFAIAKRKETFKAVYQKDEGFKMAVLIIIGLVPTGVIGIMFSSIADRLFSSIYIAGALLIVTGFLMWCTRYAVTIRAKNFSTPVAFAIGVVQGLAVLPGISRSGSTIAAALFMGIDRNTAAKYSFLMSIPAIAGAALLQLKDTHEIGISFTVLAAGMLTSCITGYLALSFLVFIVNKGKLYIFAPYCWFVGVAAIVYGYVHHF